MELSEDLQWRGQIKDKTFNDITWLDKPKTFYLGVDCSSSSMTIGNLAVFMLARRLLDAGWTTYLLVGGATSLVGDPGGKDNERDLKTRKEIEFNVQAIKQQVSKLFDGKDFTLVDNYDWFSKINYLDFLRDVGKHYSMTELLQRDYIASRIGKDGSGISYAEFSYSLIQGYDYWHLYTKYNVVLQIGGSDQWGNMLSGVPLIRKKENADVQALSSPLVLDKNTGKKFGKSEDGAIWLDAKLTSPYKFYQFWLNVDDDSVFDYLKIYTLLTKEQIQDVMTQFNKDQSGRYAQKTLAYEVTKIVHGQKKADSLQRISQALFVTKDYLNLTKDDFIELGAELGLYNVSKDSDLAQTLVDTKLASSKAEARRFIKDNAVYCNGKQLNQDLTHLPQNLINKDYCVLRRGKNNQVVISII
ncbi:MAG: tyrosyl-tRNA synthetase [Patescibacteria group bacterium]|nr:tyrosyl-tRNA synthetase [Patescibacteria group bacterium]